jgi:hypothetical protein
MPKVPTLRICTRAYVGHPNDHFSSEPKAPLFFLLRDVPETRFAKLARSPINGKLCKP